MPIRTANNLLTGFDFRIIASTDRTANRSENLCKSAVLHPAVSHASCNISFKTKDSISAILKALKHYYTFHAFLIKCSVHTLFPLGPGAPEGPGGPPGPRDPGKPGAPAIPAAPYKTSLQIIVVKRATA